ncbi:hypothetical protein EJ08DRAFT_642480 [Tothia fuscella]|uniref:Calponin-homology (CH) domain-containing protein n=1 Tax=Tothia fuscella TaxID=1048955 RepID=A0A9P4NG53_9PEZI|nr:hypothetical protein EJ08DRAFT_642480 [Tothia fuscella]
MYENTADIQYTTELQAEVRKAKPRRRTLLAPSKNKSIAIHEDTTTTLSRPQDSNSSVLMDRSQSKRQSLVGAQPRRRRVSSILADRLAASETQPPCKAGEGTAGDATHSVLKKEARRRTIYIPDDTTVVTIHPGASTALEKNLGRRQRSPDIGFDLVTLSEEENEEPLKPALKEKKHPRKSLAVAPKRAPLRQSMRPQQNVAFAEDIPGTGGGKENLPPGGVPYSSKPKDELTKARLHLGGFPSSPGGATAKASKAPVTHTKSPKKRAGTDSILDYSPKPTRVKMSKSTSRATVTAAIVVKHTFERDASARSRSRPVDEPSPTIAPKLARSTAKPATPYLDHKSQPQGPKYHVLSEDLAHPELYEDHWLHYQETALTQLINTIFQPQQSYRELGHPSTLRKKLLQLYHDPQIPLLHRRLQASLQFGALSIPKDLLAKAARIKDDIGLRKKFLALFTETYDLVALRTACEVIVGREISQPHRLSTGSNSSESHDRQVRAGRRAIERFLHTFFIRHEDAVRVKGTIASIAREHNRKDEFGSQGWAWRRTVLRSLMLIHLLDRAKVSGAIESCLFHGSSPYKTSAAVVTDLSTLILPSLGDVVRPLSHLLYTVEVTQQPLQEYEYKISNLATDLRDGVTLTRLVELVLFSLSASDADQTMTMAMPGGEKLTSTWKDNTANEWILSKHLKFPCAGRSIKLYNVQLALCAVAELGGAAAKAAMGITAEDIVDGHRERTLSLLWAIVGNCGLESLVDWKEVEKETQYFASLRSQGADSITDGFLDTGFKYDDTKTSALSLQKCSKLLLAWAQSIATQNNVQVTNLTTSFANNKAFEAIVDAYLPYFPRPAAETTTRNLRSSDVKSPFATKLKAVGSSTAFISLFSTTTTTPIPSKSFTLTTLTFLASRLIPIARTNRAASTIQCAYRSRLARLDITKHVVCMRLANHCAQVVRARERVVDAAVVLQRAWRTVLDRRIEMLVKDVVEFQSVARRWLSRERIRGGGQVRERKIRGGW